MMCHRSGFFSPSYTPTAGVTTRGKGQNSVAVCKEDGSDDEMINIRATTGGLVRGAVFLIGRNYKKNQSYYYFLKFSLSETRGLGLDLHCVCHILWRNVTHPVPPCQRATQRRGAFTIPMPLQFRRFAASARRPEPGSDVMDGCRPAPGQWGSYRHVPADRRGEKAASRGRGRRRRSTSVKRSWTTANSPWYPCDPPGQSVRKPRLHVVSRTQSRHGHPGTM